MLNQTPKDSSRLFSLNFFRSERFHRLSKEGFWVILGQVMAVVGSLIGVRVLTGLLDPAAYGELALAMTVATLAGQVVLGPLGSGVARFYAPAVEQDDLGGYLNAVRRLLVSATWLIVLLIILTVVGLMITGRVEWISITTAALVFAIFSGYSSILNSIQNAARQRSIVALHQGVESWARFIGAAVLILWLGGTSTVAMCGYAIAVILVLGSQVVFFREITSNNIVKSDSKSNWRAKMWQFSWPMSAWGMFTWMQLVSDRWALNFFSTTQEVGLYAVLFQLGYYPMLMVGGMVAQLLAPIFFQRAGDATDSRRNASVNSLSWRLIWLTLGATAVSFLLSQLFHKQIFQIFVDKEYESISYLLPWMLFAGGVFSAGQTMSLNLLSQMKSRLMMIAKIFTALLGVFFNFAGAYWFGILGIVIASVMFSGSYFLWMLVLSKHKGERTCLL